MTVTFSSLPGVQRVQSVWSGLNDIFLRIDTSTWSSDERRNHERYRKNDSNPYEGADYLNIRRVIRVLVPCPEDLIYDIGCGKGRVICVFARYPVRRVVGIDLNPGLCDVARKNAVRLLGRRSPIEIRCQNAVEADLSDGTIYFMYNPFGPETLRLVLAKIKNSLDTKPRKIRIVYYNPVFEDSLRSQDWLTLIYEFKTFTRRRVTFWSS